MSSSESSLSSSSSISLDDDINNLIRIVCGHLLSHPIVDFDLDVAKLQDGTGELYLLNSYKVSSICRYGIMCAYLNKNRLKHYVI